MDAIVSDFLSRKFESKVNSLMLYYNYNFPKNDVLFYVREINRISTDHIITEIQQNYCYECCSPSDIFQFSNWNDVCQNMCESLIDNDNGKKFNDIGKLLLNDNIIRKDAAYKKYGENHAKVASELGILNELSRTYFLSCFGYVFLELSKEDQKKFLLRLLIRTKSFRNLFFFQNGEIVLRDLFSCLADSTYFRRASNYKSLIGFILDSDEEVLKSYVERVRF